MTPRAGLSPNGCGQLRAVYTASRPRSSSVRRRDHSRSFRELTSRQAPADRRQPLHRALPRLRRVRTREAIDYLPIPFSASARQPSRAWGTWPCVGRRAVGALEPRHAGQRDATWGRARAPLQPERAVDTRLMRRSVASAMAASSAWSAKTRVVDDCSIELANKESMILESTMFSICLPTQQSQANWILIPTRSNCGENIGRQRPVHSEENEIGRVAIEQRQSSF